MFVGSMGMWRESFKCCFLFSPFQLYVNKVISVNIKVKQDLGSFPECTIMSYMNGDIMSKILCTILLILLRETPQVYY